MTTTLTIDINEIIYDVQNKTYLTGKSRATGTNHQQVAQMMANEDEENANQIRRSIHTAIGEIRTRLAEYHEISLNSATNLYDDKTDTVTLACTFPANFNSAALEGVLGAVHQYIVARAVAEWFTITDKSDAADYEKAATRALETLAEGVSKRRRPVRKVSASRP